ncbi:unnamed protein product [Pleuronectes platessa]|uniref:Uncharacterized protein n=1 Tax=Pleuronectes platessa TaxID=8262 RepID=A0A9N7VBZ3_PLEPL|nr:unnamed protein product [Pleuronectes platessa]
MEDKICLHFERVKEIGRRGDKEGGIPGKRGKKGRWEGAVAIRKSFQENLGWASLRKYQSNLLPQQQPPPLEEEEDPDCVQEHSPPILVAQFHRAPVTLEERSSRDSGQKDVFMERSHRDSPARTCFLSAKLQGVLSTSLPRSTVCND